MVFVGVLKPSAVIIATTKTPEIILPNNQGADGGEDRVQQFDKNNAGNHASKHTIIYMSICI